LGTGVGEENALERFIWAVLILIGIAIAGYAGLLLYTRFDIESVRPELPEPTAVLELQSENGLARELTVIETAVQAMPRSAVIDPGVDPDPDAPYVMTHPAFPVAWPDGRILLVDAGMDADTAVSFGAPLATLAGAEPIRPLAVVAESLGGRLEAVDGVVFTHLHQDHVDGMQEICAGRSKPLRVFQTPLQADRGNFTTLPGRGLLDDLECVELVRLDEGPMAAIPGFPGVRVVNAAGHTPGSQVVVIPVAGKDGIRTFVIAGDVVNHRAAIDENLPKPRLYRTLLVPESEPRLETVRRWLKNLGDHGLEIVVSHDRASIAKARIAPFPAQTSP